eukprot:EW709248.1.p3 GENE.EW709248.1~~EW709248.1.p3  ORF type:complete len:63 (+),score=22.66 EW709248.1:180-368(+)
MNGVDGGGSTGSLPDVPLHQQQRQQQQQQHNQQQQQLPQQTIFLVQQVPLTQTQHSSAAPVA